MGRIGGEEFAVFLPETDQPGGLELAERIRTGIAELTIKLSNAEIKLTVSVGLASLFLESGIKSLSTAESVSLLLQQADEALYQSKRGGRNRVTAISEGPP